MEVIVQWPEIMLRTINDPVCKGRTTDGCPVFPPILLLTVKGHAVRILLVDRPCNCRRGSRTFPNECRCCFGFDDHSFFGITLSILAVGTAIAFRIVLIDLTSGRCEYQLPADVFFPDALHWCTTYRTDLIFLCQRDHLFVYRKTFEKFRMGSLFLSGAWLFAAVFFRKGRVLFCLCFIKQVELSRNVRRGLFTGSAEKLLRQIVDLFLQHCFVGSLFIDDCAEGTDQLGLFGHHCLQL